MSRSGSFRYEVDAACDAATAVALLSDPRRQRELHPLIVAVDEVPTVSGALKSYAITDVLALGPLKFRIVYEADVLEMRSHDIVTVARQKPGTTVRNTTHVTETPGGVHIDVEVGMTAPTLLFGYAFRTARKAHLELGERIAARLAELGLSL